MARQWPHISSSIQYLKGDDCSLHMLAQVEVDDCVEVC